MFFFCVLYTRYAHGKQQIQKTRNVLGKVCDDLFFNIHIYVGRKKQILFFLMFCFICVLNISMIKPWMILFNRFNLIILSY